MGPNIWTASIATMQAHEERQRPSPHMKRTTLREPAYGLNTKSIYREALLALRRKRHNQEDDWTQAEPIVTNALHHLRKAGRNDLVKIIEAERQKRAEDEIAARTKMIQRPETTSSECLRLLAEIDDIRKDIGIRSEDIGQNSIGAGMVSGMSLTGGC